MTEFSVPPPAHRHLPQRREIISAILVVVLALALSVSSRGSAAQAFTYVQSGIPGQSSLYSAGLITAGNTAGARRIGPPAVNVSRSASATPGLPQTVIVRWDLMRYSGGRWITLASPTQQSYIQSYQTSVIFAQPTNWQWASGYWYTVRMSIYWYDNNNRWTGYREYNTNLTSDWVCQISTCVSSNGLVSFY